MLQHEGCCGSERLPQLYRNLPLFNLNYALIQCHAADTTSNITAHNLGTASIPHDSDSTVTAPESPSSHERHTATTPVTAREVQYASHDRSTSESAVTGPSHTVIASYLHTDM